MRVRTSSRHPRTLGAGTLALSVGLGLLTGGLGTPQAVSAAPATASVASIGTLPQAGPTVNRSAVLASAKAQLAGKRVVTEAARHKGKHYRYGAAGPKRFDCSGFTLYVYKKSTGKKLPHKANLQQKHGKAVSKSKARPGDLIIIRKGSRGTHAGIYAGGGKMWSAPRTGKTVSKQKIWSRNYVVRRLV